MIEASTKWSKSSLLPTRNMVFARLIANILQLKAQFPNHPIRKIRVDNAAEFRSKTFDEFCQATGIEVEYSTPYVHFQNKMAKALIKRIQMITRPILMLTNLPMTAWGHGVLHADALIQYRPSAYNANTPYSLVYGRPPDLSHLRTFGCLVPLPILGPKRTKLRPQRQKGIYVGFNSPSIIRYLEPSTTDVFTTKFQDCIFFEDDFPALTSTPASPNT